MFHNTNIFDLLKNIKNLRSIEITLVTEMRPTDRELKARSKNKNFVCRNIKAVCIMLITQAAVNCVGEDSRLTKGILYGYGGE